MNDYSRSGEATGRQPAVGGAMVAAPSAWATLRGIDTLRAGGNAVDAALSVSAALMVATPHQCSPGGDAFWLIRVPGGPTVGINASGFASHRADASTLRGRGANPLGRSAASVTVPGVVDGWRLAHQRFGSIPLTDLVQPAADAAMAGLRVTPYLARQIAHATPVLRRREEAARLFLPHGRPPSVGERIPLGDLARTLRRIAESPRDFYEGDLGTQIADSVSDEPTSIDRSDLQAYRAAWTEPLVRDFGGLTIEEMGPNSAGWIALIALGLLERLHAALPRSIPRLHAAIESTKVAMIVRDAVLGDPAESVAAAHFLDDDWLDEVANRIDLRHASTATELATAAGIPVPAPASHPGGTAHFAVVDRLGLAVSCIQSIYFDFGTAIVPPGTGFTLQNRGECFTLLSGHPNELRPRRQPLHTLAPAIAVLDGTTKLVFGAMGGDAQPQIHVQLLEALREDPDPALATALPRWFAGWDGPEFTVRLESRSRRASQLTALGHRVRRVAPFDEMMGHAQVIAVEEAFLVGAADPRSDGLAVGIE
jgi:gamma-glutamyltranspeptidase